MKFLTATSPVSTRFVLFFLVTMLAAGGCRTDGDSPTTSAEMNLAAAPPVAETADTAPSGNGWEPVTPRKGPGNQHGQVSSESGSYYLSLHAGAYFSFMPDAVNAGKEPMYYSVRDLPAWADFSMQTGEVFGTPQAEDLGEYRPFVITGQSASTTAVTSSPVMFVVPEPMGEDNFTPLGSVVALPDGYQSIGDLELAVDEFSQTFANADLSLAFDAEGNLLDLAGEGDLPTELTENVSVDAGISSRVGLLSGAEINADPAFGIRLMDDIDYLAFRVSAGLDITIGDPDEPGTFSSITLETPAAGEIIMITDPQDHFFYRFGATPAVGEYGEGKSRKGLIPFVPDLDYAGLDTFSGHTIQKGAMGIGFKVFDFFEIGGTRVTKKPQYFSDIDWDDPMNSAIEYKTGFNGDASFSFSVLAVGLFSFDLARASGTIDVGFDRQQAALALEIDPDESWLPGWFHWVPRTAVTGAAFINGDTSFDMRLTGTWQSTLPEADLAGSIIINNDSTTLEGIIGNGPDTLYTSIEFANDVTTGRVRFNPAWARGIQDDVLGALDREFAELEQALADLEAAISDYEFEVSLRGLRSAIPTMMDAAIATLDGIPGTIYSRARSQALSYMRNKCINFGWPVGTYCLDDVVDESSVATSIASSARSTATSYIAPLKTAMANLKTEALRGDDAAFREALRLALISAANNYRYSRKITKTYSFPWPFNKSYTVYSETYSVNVLSTTNRDKLLQAADNVYRIAETSDIVFNTSAIVDALPTEEIIDQVRSEVEAGLAQMPLPEGVGYRAIGDAYEPFIISGGDEIAIDFNVLSPSDVRNGIGDWIAENLLGGG